MIKWILLCSIAALFVRRSESQRSETCFNDDRSVCISSDQVKEAFKEAIEIIARQKTEMNRGFALDESGRSVPTTAVTPSARHQTFQKSTFKAQKLEIMQAKFEEASRILRERYRLSAQQAEQELSRVDLVSMLGGVEMSNCTGLFNVSSGCSGNIQYRTLDGACNNLQNPTWGMATTCFRRLLMPDYADGISRKPLALSGNELPSPRSISLRFHNHMDVPQRNLNHLVMAWGQFLDHDISLTPQSRGPNSELLECCPVADGMPRNCDPILVAPDDPFYRQYNMTCLNNVRSAMCSTCALGPREQINQVSAYIDASHIYGLTRNDSARLRSRDGTGRLRSAVVGEAGELLPGSAIPLEDECSGQDPNLNCFDAGDQRVNQHPALTSLHTLFLREHNRIARRLREINRDWDEETLFQESRRIVAAEIQLVTYKEYLPIVLGPETMMRYGLFVSQTGYTRYDSNMDATLANEFSTAAFRFGHSTINTFLADTRGANRGVNLRDTFNWPFELYRGQYEGVLGGLMDSPPQTFDRHMVPDVTSFLFRERGNNSGLDLASMNINRGRDHGLPGYTAAAAFCNTRNIRRWRDLNRITGPTNRELLEGIYEDVVDIDMFPGGLAERPLRGASVGPTFACILGQQFQRLKDGDRFYFEHGGQAGSFTPAQLTELRKIDLGKIICDNSQMQSTLRNAFMEEGVENTLENCIGKPEMNLDAWYDYDR